MARRLLAVVGLALLASCNTEVAGLTCHSNEDCDSKAWCNDGVCTACEPFGTACSGPADAAAPGRDAATPRADADVVVEDAAVVEPADAEVAQDTGVPPRPDAGEDAAVTAPVDAGEPLGEDAASPGRDAALRPDTGVVTPPDGGAVVHKDGGVVVEFDGAVLPLDGGPHLADSSIPMPDGGGAGADAALPGPDAAAPGQDAGPTVQPCHTATNPLVGRCSEGWQYLNPSDKTWGPCIGEVLPQPETCNGLDDDCNGTPDDGLEMLCGLGACRKPFSACDHGAVLACPPPVVNNGLDDDCDGVDDNCNGLIDENGCACVYVDLGGADTNDGLTPQTPVATINKGIAIAQFDLSTRKKVCVSAGTTCSIGSPASYAENVVMANGVNVVGGYQRSATPWVRMPACVTQIVGPTKFGYSVSFPSTVADPTQLTGFLVRANDQDYARAIEVTGSVGAVITQNTIVGGKGANSRGIVVTAGGKPKIEMNAVEGGLGTTSSIGILATNSTPEIRLNCGTEGAPIAGGCTMGAEAAGAIFYVRGRSVGGVAGAGSVGIDLVDCAGAVVSQNAVGAGGNSTHAMGLHLGGRVDGIIVAQNTLRVVADTVTAPANAGEYDGVAVTGCTVSAMTNARPAPWIAGNLIAARSTVASAAVGVQSTGLCAPGVEANQIVGNETGGTSTSSYGVRCDKDVNSGGASPCVVANNPLVAGNLVVTSGGGYSSAVGPASTAIACLGGSCQTVEKNDKVTAGTATVTVGVDLQNTKAVVDANFIDAGCPVGTILGKAYGLRASQSAARVVNNAIRGALDSCTNRAFSLTTAVGVELGADGSLEAQDLDLHSNDLLGGSGATGTCISSGLLFDSLVVAKRGLIRSNIVQAGGCGTSYAVRENGNLQPRTFLNNDLFGGVLYMRQLLPITTIVDVNAKVGPDNISADPMWDVVTFHLNVGSPCIGAGIPDQAPLLDLYGTSRVQPDIGAVAGP